MKKFFLLLGIYLLHGACSKEEIAPPLPFRVVNLVYNLNNVEMNNLRYSGGFVLIENEGVRGIVLYRKDDQRIYAFERACRHHATETCAKIEIDPSNLFMVDPCCEGAYDFEGFPIRPPARFELGRYQTSIAGDLLYVFN